MKIDVDGIETDVLADVRASLPQGCYDIYPLSSADQAPVAALAKTAGAGWDRGARRWVLDGPRLRRLARAATDAGAVLAYDLRANAELAGTHI